MTRQAELQKEMAKQKKEAAERRLAEKRGVKASTGGSRPPSTEPAGINFRSDSPPIPAIRNRSPEKKVAESGADSEVAEQLSSMRQGLERRREELEQGGGGAWDGLAEI